MALLLAWLFVHTTATVIVKSSEPIDLVRKVCEYSLMMHAMTDKPRRVYATAGHVTPKSLVEWLILPIFRPGNKQKIKENEFVRDLSRLFPKTN